MARITLQSNSRRAAERSYGVPAFNVNNMEQALAIMEAARAVNAPVIIQASRGARAYAGDIMFAKMMEALERMYPEIPLCIHQDHGERVSTCLSRHPERFYRGDDGRLADGGRQDARQLRLQRRHHLGSGAARPHGRRLGRRRTRLPRLAGNRPGRSGRRPRLRRQARPCPAADRSRRGPALRRRDQGGCAGGGHRHLARRLQVHPQADQRRAGHRP